MQDSLDQKTFSLILRAQSNEITEYYIYSELANKIQNLHNQGILETVAKDEIWHYQFWRSITHQDLQPDKLKI